MRFRLLSVLGISIIMATGAIASTPASADGIHGVSPTSQCLSWSSTGAAPVMAQCSADPQAPGWRWYAYSSGSSKPHRITSATLTLPRTLAAAAWDCDLGVSDITLSGITTFYGDTYLVCVGTINMGTAQQFLRSSWSGPRGYSLWGQYGPYPGSGTESLTWNTDCRHEAGIYNYNQWATPIVNNTRQPNPDTAPNWLNNKDCGPHN